MTSIFYGTRLAWLVGEKSKKQRIYEDDIPVDAVSSAQVGKEAPITKQQGPGGNRILKAAWLISGILTIFIPFVTRNARMNQDQNYAWNQVANQYNKYQQQEGKRFYDINNCKWYSIGCQPMYVDEAGNAVSQYEMQQEQYRQQQEKYEQQAAQQQQNYQYQYQYQQQANGQPSWYWGQSQEQRNQAMEAGQTPAALRFVYAWQMIMFIAILAYGFSVIHYHKSPAYLIGALIVWFQFNLLSMFMLADGSIVTEDRVMELSGFYGQFAVLMFIADAWYTLFGFIFVVYFLVNAPKEARLARANKPEDEKVGDYQAYKESIDAPPSPTKSDSSDEYVKVV